ncbi:hypothetical protein ACFLQY_04460 [Verrucomicrobiota bacterium]
MIHYLYFHRMKRVEAIAPEEYLPLAVSMLDKVNRMNPSKTGSPLKLYRRSEGYRLDMRESPYITYSLVAIGRKWKNILEPLNLYSLDISYLPLLSFSELESLRIKELRMVGLKIGRKHPLAVQLKRMGVKKVFMDTDAYPPVMLAKLRAHCEVVHEDAVTK